MSIKPRSNYHYYKSVNKMNKGLTSRTLSHPDGTITEYYAYDIKGKCKCGQPTTKVMNSSISVRKDRIRFSQDNETGWNVFRCRSCMEVIEETFCI